MNTIPPARSATDCQVLVVGAGPTGLVLAVELLTRGIRTRIIDQGDAAALQARAIGIHARTLEVLGMMGLAERFLADGQVVRHMRFYSEGRCLASFEFARCGSRYGFMLNLPQDQTERLLRARVAELGGVVENRTELTGLTFGSDAVTAGVRRPGGEAETITAAYVVGCDGAHSRVRRELGLTFQGLNTGMMDAHNLGWKLALVAADRAPDALLDTYGAERRPVAEDVLRLTHALSTTAP
jgi:2-polyprenyl-6-methoxyphenol hydroxylase-like FAD-dependent oxidoreductase